MNFGTALEILKGSGRVGRSGWKGKNTFLYMDPGSWPDDKYPEWIDGVHIELFETGEHGIAVRMPSIYLKSTNGTTVVGWAPSQTDLFAEDWLEVFQVSVIRQETKEITTTRDVMVEAQRFMNYSDEDFAKSLVAEFDKQEAQDAALLSAPAPAAPPALVPPPAAPGKTIPAPAPTKPRPYVEYNAGTEGDECNCSICKMIGNLKKDNNV